MKIQNKVDLEEAKIPKKVNLMRTNVVNEANTKEIPNNIDITGEKLLI